jgi:transcriptional regulator GlxA family with amidase domain
LLQNFGAQYVEERFVKQGKTITAAGVSAGIDMALHLADEIAGKEVAQVIQLIIEYDPKPPFDSGSIAKADPAIVQLAKQGADQAFK